MSCQSSTKLQWCRNVFSSYRNWWVTSQLERMIANCSTPVDRRLVVQGLSSVDGNNECGWSEKMEVRQNTKAEPYPLRDMQRAEKRCDVFGTRPWELMSGYTTLQDWLRSVAEGDRRRRPALSTSSPPCWRLELGWVPARRVVRDIVARCAVAEALTNTISQWRSRCRSQHIYFYTDNIHPKKGVVNVTWSPFLKTWGPNHVFGKREAEHFRFAIQIDDGQY